jgi:hypothetical protein
MNTKRKNLQASNRLPGYDAPTRRLEWGACVSLGLAGIVLVGMAVRDSMRFAEDQDCIVAVLSSGPNPNYHRAGIVAQKPTVRNINPIECATRCRLPEISSMHFKPKSW